MRWTSIGSTIKGCPPGTDLVWLGIRTYNWAFLISLAFAGFNTQTNKKFLFFFVFFLACFLLVHRKKNAEPRLKHFALFTSFLDRA